MGISDMERKEGEEGIGDVGIGVERRREGEGKCEEGKGRGGRDT